MKYKAHYAVAQYEFIEAEYETIVEAKVDYDNIKKVFQGEKVDGMSTLDFSKFCQKFLTENAYDNDDLDKLSPLQQWWLKTTQNAIQRIAYKNK